MKNNLCAWAPAGLEKGALNSVTEKNQTKLFCGPGHNKK